MDSMVITQKAVSMIKSRPNAAKAQEMEALAMYKNYDSFSNIRWLPPEINLSKFDVVGICHVCWSIILVLMGIWAIA